MIFTPEFLWSEEPSWSLIVFPNAGVDVTTRRFFGFPAVIIILAGNVTNVAMSAGIRKVKIRNALVRTRSRYSRRAIRKTLRIVLPHGFDEDLFQRWLYQVKFVDA